MVIKVLFYFLIISNLFGNINWVNYGWELFNYVSEARAASLGNATVAYNFDYPSSSLANPIFPLHTAQKISLTHQSRFAGIVNSELISLQLKKEKRLYNINFIFEGINNIPDTRSALIDWGYDGEYGTNDSGESNGIIDDGERLDINKIKYFSQKRIGIYGTSNFRFMDIPFGIGLKIISTFLGDHNAIGIGLDFGFYKSILNSNFGVVIKNMPASGVMWTNGYVEATRPSIEVGLHRSINFFDGNTLILNPLFSSKISLSERNMNSFFTKGQMSLDILYGLESIYREKIMLRLGQNSNRQLTGGVGIDWDKFIVDYAFLPSSINGIFANHHLISLSIYFDWLLALIKNKS